MQPEQFNKEIEKEFETKRIDRELTIEILERYNRGDFSGDSAPTVEEFPQIDGERIVDTRHTLSLSLPKDDVYRRLSSMLEEKILRSIGTWEDNRVSYGERDLYRLGLHLLPYTAYGILNGGSATSYVDEKKNADFNSRLFELNTELFHRYADQARGTPKGITPAFIQPDLSPGPSFLELKMRSLLIMILRYRKELERTGVEQHGPPPLPLFQMTSVYNDEIISRSYEEYNRSPLLSDLMEQTGVRITDAYTGIQPLIAAYTHSSEGHPKGVFTRAWSRENSLLPLPGGHGQNFIALRDIYLRLHDEGYRFAYLGNVDNLGNMPDPKTIALTALGGNDGAFEFSFKTPVDVKGGVLIRDTSGKLNAVDIGAAVSKEEVSRAEEAGKPILFNCATGLFDLDTLSGKIDHIIRELPTRFSDQNKDAGKYSQAEQITWEIISMMENPLILGVEKNERFLAAKLFMENLLTSGIGSDSELFPDELRGLTTSLHGGLENLLRTSYGMKKIDGRWEPMSVEEPALESTEE